MKIILILNLLLLSFSAFSQEEVEQTDKNVNENLKEIQMEYYEATVDDERTLEMIRKIKERRKERDSSK